MANQWFKFKHFEIKQDQCAMKVGTDSVILGAWTDVEYAKKALDIGTGTGLLALMLAQRSSTLNIDAVEIEGKSAMQATSNFLSSKFSSRIQSFEISFSDHCRNLKKPLYDLIICNPPYFSSSLRAPEKERSLARHDDTLSLEELFEGVARILLPDGKMSIVLPADLKEKLSGIAAEYDLFPLRVLNIKPTPEKKEKRVCLEYGFQVENCWEETLIIEEGGRHIYSEAYIDLTKAFYLEF